MIKDYFKISQKEVDKAITDWNKWQREYEWSKKERKTEEQIKDFYLNMPVGYVADIDVIANKKRGQMLGGLGDVKEKRVLDFGCGTGRYGEALLEQGAIVDFVDLNTPAIDFMKWRFENDKREGWSFSETIPDKKYDIILLIDVLEHITTPSELFKRLKGQLIEGGNIVFSTPLAIPITEGRILAKKNIVDNEHLEEAYDNWDKNKMNDYITDNFIVNGNLLTQTNLRILLLYNYHPHTTGAFIEKQLRKMAKVITPRQTGIAMNGEGIKTIVDKLNITHVLQIDSGVNFLVPKLDIPVIYYSIDTFDKTDFKMEQMRGADFIFYAQRKFVKRKNEEWLPLGADTDVYRQLNTIKKYEVGFCGTILVDKLHHERNEMLRQITNDFNFYWGKDSNEYANLRYNESYFTFNFCIANDLNMRVFEAMASGSILLCNDCDGIDDYFESGKHYFKYKDYEDLKNIVNEWGGKVQELINISRTAREEIANKHTYYHRAIQICNRLKKLTKIN